MTNVVHKETSFQNQSNEFSRRVQGKRLLANPDACKIELKNELRLLFKTFSEAIEKANLVLCEFQPNIRARALDATVFQSSFAEKLFNNFGESVYWGKYKRLILRVNGYLILFKKLDKKGYPMNIKTLNIQSILNQNQSLDLFAESDYNEDPILYFGYKKDKIGNYVQPQLIYIDEEKIQFSLNEHDIEIQIEIEENKVEKIGVMPKLKGLKESNHDVG